MLITDKADLENLRKSGQIAALTFEHVEKILKPGLSAFEIDQEIDQFIRTHNAQPAFLGYRNYPASSNFSLNNEIVHGIPTKNKIIQEEDVFTVDLGVIYGGMYTDTARTYTFSRSKVKQKMLQDTKKALDLALNRVRPRGKIFDITQEINSFGHLNGYYIPNNIGGHGLGKTLHEEPLIPNILDLELKEHLDFVLKPGKVIAIEPIFLARTPKEILISEEDEWTMYADQQDNIATHFEHTVLVTKKGIEILTILNT